MALRKDLALKFLKQENIKSPKIKPLAADASFRSYHRLEDENGKSYVLMDAPPLKEEIKPFISVGEKLVDLGFSAPKIFAKDIKNGFLLLEDLGDETYTNCLKKGIDENKLYKLAVETLISLNSIKQEDVLPDDLPLYDDDKLLEEACLLVDWYVPAIKEIKNIDKQEYLELWKKLLPLTRKVPDTMVLRDYHIDNLILLDRKDVQACGLLDFQDAVKGPVTYDIMSLLEDARRDISQDLIDEMKELYFSKYIEKVGNVCSKDEFINSWDILAALRHAKVIGIFTRLCVRDNKSQYLKHINRVWSLLEKSIENPVLCDIKKWLDTNIPKQLRETPNAI